MSDRTDGPQDMLARCRYNLTRDLILELYRHRELLEAGHSATQLASIAVRQADAILMALGMAKPADLTVGVAVSPLD